MFEGQPYARVVAFGERLSALLREGRVGALAAKDHFLRQKPTSKQALTKNKNIAMKTFLLPLVFLFCGLVFTPQLYSQYKKPNRIFKKGQADIFAGFGLLPTFLKDRATQELPPLSLRYENRLANNYSIGLEIGHSISTTDARDPTFEAKNYRNRFYYVGLRNTVHCNCEAFDNWDIYGGFSLGYNLTNISVIEGAFGDFEKLHGIKEQKSKMTFHGFVGARYACNASLSFYGEFGYGISIIQLGVGYQL
ncbi:MAG: hypothetical protein DHS20C18_46550 [Saprospiraceae bacterium]|nr:MAG: hypothetical protein DHS20C18_46550 [Saprospiraceae bacterium]